MAEKNFKTGTEGFLVPMDEKHPDDLDSSILCSISEDEIALNLPVKYLRSNDCMHFSFSLCWDFPQPMRP